MKKLILFALLTGFAFSNRSYAVDTTWSNTGTDYNTAANWSNGTPAGRRDLFTTDAIMQPNISASLSAIGLFFSANNYDITATAGATLTLTAYGTGGAVNATNSTAAAIYSSATGTNTIDGPILFAPASGTTSSIFQSGNGTLILNGVLSGGVTLSLNGGGNASPGTIQLNGNNTFSSGVTISGTAETLVIGSDTGLGTGTFTVSSTSTVQAGGGARTIGNATVLNGTATVGGTNNLTFNGSVTAAGAVTRTFTVTNTATTTLAGNVFLSDAAATGRTLVINGGGALTISGVIADFNGAGTAGILRNAGSGTLTLSNTNTYSGGTQITTTGTIIANHDGALGTGGVSLSAAGVTLTLQNGATNNYINDNASLSIVTGALVNLNFTTIPDVIGGLTIDGAMQAPGLYNATTNPTLFFGTGSLLVVVPEPATYILMGLGFLVCAQQFRRKKA